MMEPYKVNSIDVVFNFGDNGGRRIGIERRQFSYSSHIPERRYSKDRRTSMDRRIENDRRKQEDRRTGLDRRNISGQPIVIDLRTYRERRNRENRRGGLDRRDFIIM